MIKEKYLEALDFNDLTPIQEQSFKLFGSNKNIVGIAPTGTGKTHAYLIPLVDHLTLDSKHLEAVILVPTNELVNQVRAMMDPLIDQFKVRTYNSQTDRLREERWLSNNTPNVVITTPERLLQMREHGLNINNIKYLILDEADMMFDEDFLSLIDKVVSGLNNTKYLLYSASINENMFSFIRKYFGNYDLVDTRDLHELKIDFKNIKTFEESKIGLISDLTEVLDPYLSIIFVSTKVKQQEVFNTMRDLGRNVILLSGDLNQHQRKNIIRDIHSLKYQYVVASDLAARGIDFDASHIINYDLPRNLEFFKHRSGRTGRMGKSGEVISLITNEDRHRVTRLTEMGYNFSDYHIRGRELVRERVRTEVLTKEEIQAIKSVPKPKKVKPNYKKKNKEKIKKAKQQARRNKRGKNR